MLSPYLGRRCAKCGLPDCSWSAHYAQVSSSNPHGISGKILCGACLAQAPPWKAVAYHGLYLGALREMVLRLKFGGELALLRTLGAFLLEAASCLTEPDLIVPLPLADCQLRKRGFNQANELGRELSRLSGIPVSNDVLLRVRSSPPQASLSARERLKNVRGVFKAQSAASGLRVWLLDDVLTTGSTLAEASRALLCAGVREVSALVLARTPSP